MEKEKEEKKQKKITVRLTSVYESTSMLLLVCECCWVQKQLIHEEHHEISRNTAFGRLQLSICMAA